MQNDNLTNDKQSLKKKRIKMYFLESAKDIIINEGVENVSVRKIANMAGYSYATIYNYYDDLNELLWDVKAIMINELFEYIQKKMNRSAYDCDGLKKLFKTYVDYYFENPNIFNFFYFHHLSKPVKSSNEAEPDYSEMWAKTFSGFVHSGKLQEKDIEVAAKIFIYSMHGMLTLSFSSNGDLTKNNVYRDLEKIVDYLL